MRISIRKPKSVKEVRRIPVAILEWVFTIPISRSKPDCKTETQMEMGAIKTPPPSARPEMTAALMAETGLDAEGVARKAMAIAAEICVYTNGNLTVETV